MIRFGRRSGYAFTETKMKEQDSTRTRLEARTFEDDDAPSRLDVYVYIVVLAGAMLVAGLS